MTEQLDKFTDDGQIDRDPSHYTVAEITAINNRELIKANPQNLATASTLCWLCKKCLNYKGNDCEKTTKGKTVPSWTAEETEPDRGIKAWKVIDCPKFDFVRDLNWNVPTVFPIIKRWCTTKSGSELYYKAVGRDPKRWIDEYNKKMPEECRLNVYYGEYDEYDDTVDEELERKAAALKSSGYDIMEGR